MDPEIGRPIEDIGMLKDIQVDDALVRVHVLITIEGCPLKDRITQDVTAAVKPLEGVERVDVHLTPMSPEQRETLVGQLRGGATAAQLQGLAEDLLQAGMANREALTNIVRYEVDRALGHAMSMGAAALPFDHRARSPDPPSRKLRCQLI